MEQKTLKKRGRKALILTSDQIKQVEHLASLNKRRTRERESKRIATRYI